MSVILEDVLVRIKQLLPAEIALLRDLLNKELRDPKSLPNLPVAVHGDNGNEPLGEPAKRRLTPIPIPDQSGALKWLAENARDYKGQWVALDGERLIAYGTDAREVYAAARADGAYLPLVELVENPDGPPFAGF